MQRTCGEPPLVAGTGHYEDNHLDNEGYASNGCYRAALDAAYTRHRSWSRGTLVQQRLLAEYRRHCRDNHVDNDSYASYGIERRDQLH